MLNPNEWPERLLQGSSDAAQRLRTQVERVAPYFRSAVLVGEAGCWKEQVARALHARSPLRDREFIVCRASELARATLDRETVATLFIPGLPELSPSQQQVIIQRIRQPGQCCREKLKLIFASEVPLRALVSAGRISPDLPGCVGAEIGVVPLRERVEDFPAMLDGLALESEATKRLAEHHWPGNLRELHEVLRFAGERAGANRVGVAHLPTLVEAAEKPEDMRLDAVLRRHVYAVLEGCAGNKLRAAEMLGISRSTLYRMLEAG